MSIDLEGDSFRSSILYWIWVLESEANLQFVKATGGGKSNVAIWRTLSVLSELDGIAIGEFAQYTQIERTALSHLLTQMEKQGFVKRRSMPNDRRTTQVFILEKGKKTFLKMLPLRRAIIRRAARNISRKDLEVMMVTTRRLVDNLRRHARPDVSQERKRSGLKSIDRSR